MKAKMIVLISLLILLLIPFNFIHKRNHRELNVFDSLIASFLLLTEPEKQLEQNILTALPDATRVSGASLFHEIGVEPAESKWIDREVYIKPADSNSYSYRTDAKDQHQSFIRHYAILPERVQPKDSRRKTKKFSAGEFDNAQRKGGNVHEYPS